MDKALNYVGLARKAGRIELGEEPVGAVTRALRAHLVVVAQDASDHTWRRAKSFVAGTDQPCIRVDHTKEQLGMAVGRTSLALAAFTDPALALAFVNALSDPGRYGAVAEHLEEVTRRLQQRKKEAKAHQRNKRQGRVRPKAKKEH